mmetsp:Transcript_73210/g.211973  ORF Transcript_73210/g.211973 Transcript_73210/m.211973 type:complete len:436 (-) Transcript_73210:19-1326(-)
MRRLHSQGVASLRLRHFLHHRADDLVGHVVHVGSSTHCVDGVDETHLLEPAAIRQADRDLPTIVHDLASAEGILLEEEADVVLERRHVQLLAIQEHRAPTVRGGGDIVSSASHQGRDVLLQHGHGESVKVGPKGDHREVLHVLALRPDGRRVPFLHVLFPDLLVVLAGVGVCCLDDELRRIDVRQLRAVAVSATGDLLLAVVVVVARQQVPEHELRNETLVLFVLLNRQALAIVPDGDAPVLGVHLDTDSVLRRAAHQVVCGVDQNLVEDFVQRRHILELPLHHPALGVIEHPLVHGLALHRADVGVWPQKDVFLLRLLLVDLLDGSAIFASATSSAAWNSSNVLLVSLHLRRRRGLPTLPGEEPGDRALSADIPCGRSAARRCWDGGARGGARPLARSFHVGDGGGTRSWAQEQGRERLAPTRARSEPASKCAN